MQVSLDTRRFYHWVTHQPAFLSRRLHGMAILAKQTIPGARSS